MHKLIKLLWIMRIDLVYIVRVVNKLLCFIEPCKVELQHLNLCCLCIAWNESALEVANAIVTHSNCIGTLSCKGSY